MQRKLCNVTRIISREYNVNIMGLMWQILAYVYIFPETFLIALKFRLPTNPPPTGIKLED